MVDSTVKYWAVVPAAGVGKRMQADRPKQYLTLNGRTVIENTLERLLSAQTFTAVSVAISKEDGYWPALPIAKHDQIITAPGGKERADSVLSALQYLSQKAAKDDWVLVHDAARPCITTKDILLLIDTLKTDPVGGILALPSHDTLKQVAQADILQTMDRNQIWRALTPQMFRFDLLKNALMQAAQADFVVTDEASAVERLGLKPKIVEGRPENIKITRSEDLALAEFYLENQC